MTRGEKSAEEGLRYFYPAAEPRRSFMGASASQLAWLGACAMLALLALRGLGGLASLAASLAAAAGGLAGAFVRVAGRPLCAWAVVAPRHLARRRLSAHATGLAKVGVSAAPKRPSPFLSRMEQVRLVEVAGIGAIETDQGCLSVVAEVSSPGRLFSDARGRDAAAMSFAHLLNGVAELRNLVREVRLSFETQEMPEGIERRCYLAISFACAPRDAEEAVAKTAVLAGSLQGCRTRILDQKGLASYLGKKLGGSTWHPPTACCEAWGSVRVGGFLWGVAFVSAWPRSEVEVDYLHPLLVGLKATSVLSVLMRPTSVPASLARTRAKRADAVSNMSIRKRYGFLERASDREELSKLEAAEKEVARGFAEFEVAALLAVRAEDEVALARALERADIAASGCGLRVERLFGEQAGGLFVSLVPGAQW